VNQRLAYVEMEQQGAVSHLEDTSCTRTPPSVAVPTSVFSATTTVTASFFLAKIGLRVYGSIAGPVACAFFVLTVYVAAAVDLGAMATGQCKSLLTFVHEDWWGAGLQCAK